MTSSIATQAEDGRASWKHVIAMDASNVVPRSLPNNLGPFLLIAAGLVTAPFGLGIVVLVLGVALLKDANGEVSFPRLQGLLRLAQNVQFWRVIKL